MRSSTSASWRARKASRVTFWTIRPPSTLTISPMMNEARSDLRLVGLPTPKVAETNDTFAEISLK
jgi:hypothetical protein